MTRSARYLIPVFLVALLTRLPAQPRIGELRGVKPAGLRHVAEFTFGLEGRYENPYDSDQVKVDAIVTGPTGQTWLVPAFWFEPYSRKVEESKLELSQKNRGSTKNSFCPSTGSSFTIRTTGTAPA